MTCFYSARGPTDCDIYTHLLNAFQVIHISSPYSLKISEFKNGYVADLEVGPCRVTDSFMLQTAITTNCQHNCNRTRLNQRGAGNT